MAIASIAAAEDSTTRMDVLRLREQIDRMQRRTARVDALPVPGPLSPLFPEGGLRPGAAYALPPGETGLLLSLLGEVSRTGAWCAVVGVPELSVEAAEGHGVDLSRLALLPSPGGRWLQAASAAAEVFPLVAVRPPSRPGTTEVARLEARLRDRGAALISLGGWPGADAEIATADPEWRGIGQGHGLISSRALTISLTGRRVPRSRRTRVLLPGPTGHVENLPTPDAARRPILSAVAS
ncbi:hypothetical protein [Microbacterium sediminis]|uniref:hypothetical protein n=1 Tax=Microbacterium sediminis TaxID=904291 RepID=UPI00107278BF|nr:hypothetical protein [Microbacterium sediminis]QBR74336.1 hypothetical protein E3O41_07900 [Microbacterium sediminis]